MAKGQLRVLQGNECHEIAKVKLRRLSPAGWAVMGLEAASGQQTTRTCWHPASAAARSNSLENPQIGETNGQYRLELHDFLQIKPVCGPQRHHLSPGVSKIAHIHFPAPQITPIHPCHRYLLTH
jgi:hypothetical protein